MKLFGLAESDDEEVLFTPWTIPHILVGAAAKERGIPLLWFELGHFLYEVKDQVENQRQNQLNTLANSIADQAAATVGHLVVNTNTSRYFWTALYVGSWLSAVALGDSIG